MRTVGKILREKIKIGAPEHLSNRWQKKMAWVYLRNFRAHHAYHGGSNKVINISAPQGN